MTLRKRFLSAALCLCLLCAAVPVRTGAAASLPITVSAKGTSYQYAVGGKDVSQLKYGTATSAKTAGSISAAAEGDGVKVTFDTGYNKNFKLCYKEVPVTVTVPANTTYSVEFDFALNGTHRRENVRAVASATYFVAYLGETAASGSNSVEFYYDTPKTTVNGSSAAAVMQFRQTYEKGAGSKNTAASGTKKMSFDFTNKSYTAKSITQYFGFWVVAAYGSTYKNQLTADFTITPKTIGYNLKFDASGGTVGTASKRVTTGTAYGELPVPTREKYNFCGWYTEKYGEGREITSASTVSADDGPTLYAFWIGEPDVDRWSTDETIEYGQQSYAGSGGLQVYTDTFDYLFEWYKCDDRNRTNAVKVGSRMTTSEGSGPPYRTPSDLPVGTYYYYSVITNILKENPDKSASATGPVAEVTVVPGVPQVSTWPEKIQINLNSESNRLGDYEIIGATMKNKYSGAAVPGKFSWVNPDTVLKPDAGSTWADLKAEVLFTPDDSKNYTTTIFKAQIEALHSHVFVDGEITVNPTCTASGKRKQSCSICGFERTATVPASGHDYENGIWLSDETRHRKQCAACDSTDTPEEHIFGAPVGEKRTCKVCGYEERKIITVTITWSEMAFTYTDGVWDPETHDFPPGEWTADSADGDIITVENEGDGEVTVSFVYTPLADFVNGSFEDETGAAIESPAALPAGDRKYARLRLDGKPQQDTDAAVIGTVTVYIGGDE